MFKTNVLKFIYVCKCFSKCSITKLNLLLLNIVYVCFHLEEPAIHSCNVTPLFWSLGYGYSPFLMLCDLFWCCMYGYSRFLVFRLLLRPFSGIFGMLNLLFQYFLSQTKDFGKNPFSLKNSIFACSSKNIKILLFIP